MERHYTVNVINYNLKFGFPYTCSKVFFLLSILFSLLFMLNKKSYLLMLSMLDTSSLNLDFCILVDWISLLFFATLCIMVSCVLKFSCVYMEKDPFQVRFTWLVLSFVLSMACLMFFPHFFFLLMGWDGLGMTSFLLVMYYLSDSSWAAGMKTYLINRVGDGFFMVGLVLFLYKGHWDMKSMSENNILGIMMVLGCFTKSAQFPFSSWLPAAMAAPTPVSSLVHSSTLVTAGMYLMIRFADMFSQEVFILIGMCGLWTLYSASLAACSEYDGKKVVAYSTLSQLGLMAVAISLNLPMFAFFHLMTHAMFKALMFMCVGYLINKMGHFQDLRSLKGLWITSPTLAMTLMVSSLSLLGFPFLAGFFSKELMLENQILVVNNLFNYLVLLSLPLTSYYSSRLTFNMLNGVKYKSMSCKNDGKVLLFSMFPLYMGCIFMGCAMSPTMPSFSGVVSACHLSKFFTSFFILSGMMLCWFDVKMKKNSFIWFCSSMSFLTPFNSSFMNDKLSKTGSNYYYLLDQGMLQQTMSSLDKGLTKSGSWLSSSLSYFTFPRVGYYVMKMLSLSFLLGIVT